MGGGAAGEKAVASDEWLEKSNKKRVEGPLSELRDDEGLAVHDEDGGAGWVECERSSHRGIVAQHATGKQRRVKFP